MLSSRYINNTQFIRDFNAQEIKAVRLKIGFWMNEINEKNKTALNS